ncbi:3-oxoacyl-[acyl-carrier-protein] synthase 2 [bacterium BMS3Abin07]|nr:3-oxoacyl-[acyl-carrier-protein] synthase 2 [bacterium BMS3Abin07]GBE32029.1 3-oxoacyl-[acyl-carrier-protein] synthase 2 [bacterium BMS3Bbin05]
MKRAVVTGIGAVTPLGNFFGDSWNNLLKGVSGISKIDRFDVAGMPYQNAGQVRNLDVGGFLSMKEMRRYDRFMHYAYISSQEALEDAGLSGFCYTRGNSAISVVCGSGRGAISSIEKAVGKQSSRSRRRNTHMRMVSPYFMPLTATGMSASLIAQKNRLTGECIGISNACASGLSAVGVAYRMIGYGSSEIVIAVGADAPLTHICFEGYLSCGALSKKNVSRPFDSKRDGFLLSEGACTLILEEYGHAVRRGARVYGEVIGYAGGMDAFDQVRPSSGGESATIEKAIGNAGIDRDAIGFVSTHAASTILGDISESIALEQVFGGNISGLPVSAFKSMTGHMLAASGVFEAAASFKVISDGVIPPTLNLEIKDPECSLNVITERRKSAVDCALVNSFGFGGINSVLIIKGADR